MLELLDQILGAPLCLLGSRAVPFEVVEDLSQLFAALIREVVDDVGRVADDVGLESGADLGHGRRLALHIGGGKPHLIAGYLCTPLVKFPVASLGGKDKVVGTTIAELGAGNRPIDMLVYRKDGKEFLLMSNTSRGVMKIPTDGFATAAPITSRIGGTAGVAYETIATMTNVMQMDLLDANRSIVLVRGASGLNLQAVPLP